MHEAAGELVHDHNLGTPVASLDDVAVPKQYVVASAAVDGVGAQGLLDVVDELERRFVVEVVDVEHSLQGGDAGLGEAGRAQLQIERVMGFFHKPPHNLRHLVVMLGGLFGGAGNDERGARLVDEDVVDFVNDPVVQAALHTLVQRVDHVVAQVVEPELVVGAEGQVGGIGGAPLVSGHAVLDDADAQPQPFDQSAAVPVGVAVGQVIVDGDDVHALVGQGVEIGGQRGDRSLAFTGAHFGNVAAMQHHAADELYVELPLAGVTADRFAHRGKCFGQQVVQRLAGVEALAECRRLAEQFLVRAGAQFWLHRVDALDQRREATRGTAGIVANDSLQQSQRHVNR